MYIKRTCTCNVHVHTVSVYSMQRPSQDCLENNYATRTGIQLLTIKKHTTGNDEVTPGLAEWEDRRKVLHMQQKTLQASTPILL